MPHAHLHCRGEQQTEGCNPSPPPGRVYGRRLRETHLSSEALAKVLESFRLNFTIIT